MFSFFYYLTKNSKYYLYSSKYLFRLNFISKFYRTILSNNTFLSFFTEEHSRRKTIKRVSLNRKNTILSFIGSYTNIHK